MMFFVSKKVDNNNEHIVHSSNCDYLPLPISRLDLGELYSCESAMERAKEFFENSNGCIHCCLLCYAAPVLGEKKS